ncbi:reverse transcriptase domain-containing protein [Labilibaculum euxinus]
MSIPQIYKDVSQKLFDIFYVDDYKYGRQLDNGSYRLVKEKITPVTIEDMLLRHKSLLTYQELHTLDDAYIKWVCIDLDISKSEIDSNEVNRENLKLVKQSADDICAFLKSINLPYLLEFSGRRGFHIWIIFEELLTKEDGYNLIFHVLSQVKLQENIIADKFPTTPIVAKNSKGIGKGVKLPLSQNKASGALSFFIGDNELFDFEKDNWKSEPSNDFLLTQLEILNNVKVVSKEFIQNIITTHTTADEKYKLEKYLKSKKISPSFLPEGISLDNVLKSLKKCGHIEMLLKDYQKGLSAQERSILSGLLGQLKTEKEPNFGYKLLLELFSKIQGFKEDITVRKLENIKYYSPITCVFWDNCKECKRTEIISPVQLIEGITLEDVPAFTIKNIDSRLFERIKNAQHKYSMSNDEVPLFPQLQKIDVTNEKEISTVIEDIFNGNFSFEKESYKFNRIEGKKTRTLYNLDHKSNLITTYFLFILNNLFYTEISNFSFGYQIALSFYNDNIFTNWFINWGKFSKNVEHVIYNEEYDDYFLVKIDIKGFYDNIEIQRLRMKLFEEAPPKIKAKLSELPPSELTKYKNIVNYLTLLTKKVTGNNEKGVPQGPAYARYLSELYLLGLDNTIEDYIKRNKGKEFYNRFVDDAYIFLESEERAIELNEEINRWLHANMLELNVVKSDLCNVKKYRESGKFKRYKDDAKYTINRVNKNKNILTDKEIQEAFIKLEHLTDNAKFGLKDNLRFFFFQFKDDIRVKHIRKKLIEILPFSIDGRGTLYLMFYTDLIRTSPKDFLKLFESIDKIRGLSLTHFLNTILLEWESIENKNICTQELIDKVSSRKDLCEADKLLILTISIKQNIKMSKEYLDNCSTIIKTSALETPNIKYCYENYSLIQNELEDIKDSELFLKRLYKIINNNELDLDVAQELAKYTFIRFSEWSQDDEKCEFLKQEINILLYYHCVCFFTLFDTSKHHNSVTESWKLLLRISENLQVNSKIEFLWIKQLDNFKSNDFSNNSYSLLLGNTNGSEFAKYCCLNKFVEKYRNVLLFLLFSQMDNFASFLSNITSFSDNSLFYSWLKDSNVELYPKSHKICMQNLAVNGLIVLENNTLQKIFIKSVGCDISSPKFDFIECSEIKNNELEYSKGNFTSFGNHFKSTDFVSSITLLSELIGKHDKFKETYNLNYPVFYNPVFFNGGNPLVPFYSLYNKIVSEKGMVKVNSIEYYWENLLAFIRSLDGTQIRITPDDNLYSYSLNELDEKFFPNSELIINSNADKIIFLKEFAQNVNNNQIKTIFDFQYYWTVTAINVISIKEKGLQNILLKYLCVHFDHFMDRKDIIRDILFAVNKNTIPKGDNLLDFMATIRKSIVNFQSELTEFKSFISNVFDKYSSVEEDAFSKIEAGKDRMSFDEFKIGKVTYIEKENYNTNAVETILEIYGSKIDINNVSYYDHSNNEFQPLSSEKAFFINSRDYVFVHKIDSNYYLYIPEKELIKAFERIVNRKIIYDEIYESGVYSSNKKLFCDVVDYDRAATLYDQENTVELERKLQYHYASTTNIKERIVSWLSLFSEQTIIDSKLKMYMSSKGYSLEKLYSAIIECLSSHIAISSTDISSFKEKITEYNSLDDHIIFPLKHPYRDGNGLERLFAKCDYRKREIDVEKDVKKLLELDCSDKTIVIVTDISISGSQARKALKYYMNNYKDYSEFRKISKELEDKNEKYFTINNISELNQLQINIKKARNIIFISPIMTEIFKENITAELERLSINTSMINWEFSKLLKEDDYLLGKKRINKENRDLLYELMKDRDLIKKVFQVESISDYKKSVSKTNLAVCNTLLRVGSLPTKHIKMFSLTPTYGVNSLLDYVYNWEK